MPQLILASGSKGRQELLTQAGYHIDRVCPQDVDETPFKAELPKDYVSRIALAKFQAAVEQCPQGVVLSADTITVTGRRIFQKPGSEGEARAMLRHFSGRRVRILTSVCIGTADTCKTRTVVSAVKIKPLSADEIDSYIQTKDWVGVSGGLKLQGLSSVFIMAVQGDFTNIVGLPMTKVYNLLKSFKVCPKWQIR